MRLCIFDPQTRKFTKMVNAFCIDPHSINDRILYVQDAYGTFYTLTFLSHAALAETLSQLEAEGHAKACCDLCFYYEEPTIGNDDFDREIDPNLFQEDLDIWGFEYGR